MTLKGPRRDFKGYHLIQLSYFFVQSKFCCMICGFKYSRKDTLKVNIKIQGCPQRMRLKRPFQDLIKYSDYNPMTIVFL